MSWKRWNKRQAGHLLFNSNGNKHAEICVCLLGGVLANSFTVGAFVVLDFLFY